ncbi:DEKNAAC101219 [Brettanomyces naardenensis]|uniref:DEKNAAC101219 n=1 Tax=Brettanomyces naardenensis TaxID=13370 RepID=A0A448YH73_BRENA|nr:DEKNAAC101219 [Brettanomyces naardenensis]
MSSTSSWTTFLRSIASYNGDLSSLTAPPFILSPNSLLEYHQYWGTNTELLLAPNWITKPVKYDTEPIQLRRMLAVIKWFLATLKSQYASRTDGDHSEKKPLNPFLGEVFVAKFEDESPDKTLGETDVILEQVSHHPPVSGYAVWNKKHNTLLEGFNGIRASMGATSLNVRQYGHAVLEYKDLKENYLFTLPPLHLEGLLTGSPRVELEQKSYIQASTGYYAVLEYSGRGYFSGSSNTFKCRVYRNRDHAVQDKYSALYTIAGQWSGISTYSKGAEMPSSKGPVFLDISKVATQTLVVKPISEQHPLESRRAWQKVADAIRQGDYQLISNEKTMIENEQRELRKYEKDNDSDWERRWFDDIDYTKKSRQHDPYIRLFKMAHLSTKNVPSGVLDTSSKNDNVTTMNHWRFNRGKFVAENEIHC